MRGGGVAAELGGGDARHGAAGSEASEGTGGDGGQGGASVGHYFGARREFGQRGGGSGAVRAHAAAHVASVDHCTEVGISGEVAAVFDGEVRHAAASV